ncbi:GNAT family N-acetyltransferase [Chelatococcus sambhunathii]|uniref:GNAT family N-acetyltransferase n=1 Tax=Chelatococcus sambhunathii TaxID=363953 RepID=A0ABU1DKS0_9HYPH|nr:GNAT family protein [Chelatococcus sambhunathii]MDR4308741.1 GNAT family N-acetyltransferase [Chelatococcus sambhunathii]
MSDRTPPIDPATNPPRGPLVGGQTPPRPQPATLQGRHVRLGPLDPAKDAADLFPAVSGPERERLFAYLVDAPFESEASLRAALEAAASTNAAVTLAIRDASGEKTLGRASFMRIEPAHRSVEVGSILFSPSLSRTPAGTEAMYLMAAHAFDLGYRRYEWKCDALNAPSRAAALRFGFRFEGIFERHMIIKGRSRDTAWFAMTEDDWPANKAAFEAWLDPANFDGEGRQIRRLAEFRAAG